MTHVIERIIDRLLAHRDDAYLLAYRILGRAEDAEDTVQEAYLKMLRTDNIPTEDDHVRNWVLRVTANTAKNFRRSERRRVNREKNAGMNAKEVNHYRSESDTGHSELKTLIAEAIENLDEKYRVAICMHYEEELAYEKAAAILDVPAYRLRNWASRGLKKIREALAGQGYTVRQSSIAGVIGGGLGIQASAGFSAGLKKTVLDIANHGNAARLDTAHNSARKSARRSARKSMKKTLHIRQGAGLSKMVIVPLVTIMAGVGLLVGAFAIHRAIDENGNPTALSSGEKITNREPMRPAANESSTVKKTTSLAPVPAPDSKTSLRSIFKGKKFSFGPKDAPVPKGYIAVSDERFTEQRGYGWITNHPRRFRFRLKGDDLLHSRIVFAGSNTFADKWEISVPNGVYRVSVGCGDPIWKQGPNRVVAEGVVMVDNVYTDKNAFVEVHDVPVPVRDGRMTFVIGVPNMQDTFPGTMHDTDTALVYIQLFPSEKSLPDKTKR